jgi:hypothetical protein
VDVPVRHDPRSGHQRGQEHTGAGAQRLGLWRRSETAPLLEREGICL